MGHKSIITPNELHKHLDSILNMVPDKLEKAPVDRLLLFQFRKSISEDGYERSTNWWIHIFAPWIITTETEFLATSYSNDNLVDTALDSLMSVALIEAKISYPGYDTTLFFGSGLRLRIFPIETRINNPAHIPAWAFDNDADQSLIAIQPEEGIMYYKRNNE